MKWFFKKGSFSLKITLLLVASMMIAIHRKIVYPDIPYNLGQVVDISFIAIFVYSAFLVLHDKILGRYRKKQEEKLFVKYILEENTTIDTIVGYSHWEQSDRNRYEANMVDVQIGDVDFEFGNSKVDTSIVELYSTDIKNLNVIANVLDIRIVVVKAPFCAKTIIYDKNKKILSIPSNLVGKIRPKSCASSWAIFAALYVYYINQGRYSINDNRIAIPLEGNPLIQVVDRNEWLKNFKSN